MTTKRSAKAPAKRTPAKRRSEATPKSMPAAGRDPKGGLTAKGRAYFEKKEGAHLRPGVQGPADTPEKMVRKGSFLRRHFANPRGPMKDEKGQPTRLALSAHAWGEEVPQTTGDAKKLAATGHELLERYHELQDGQKASRGKTAAQKRHAKTTAGKATAKKTTAEKAATRKTAGGKTAAKKRVAKKTAAKKTVAKKIAAKKTAVKKTVAKRTSRQREAR